MKRCAKHLIAFHSDVRFRKEIHNTKVQQLATILTGYSYLQYCKHNCTSKYYFTLNYRIYELSLLEADIVPFPALKNTIIRR